MSERKKPGHAHTPPAANEEAGPTAPAPEVTADDAATHAPGALVEPPVEAIARLEEEIDALKDRHLRLAAEYDNFRKRTIRERADLWGKAQAELIVRLVDALDDLARFAHIDPAQTDAATLHAGIDLVERKFWKELQVAGVTRIDQVGAPFDPQVHEAVTTAPAATAEQDHTVGAILQAGYKMGETLLRPARVQVLTWQGGPGDAA